MAASRVQSRVGSRMGSRLIFSVVIIKETSQRAKHIPSYTKVSIIIILTTTTRTNSMSSVHNVDGELPETLGSIKSVTDSQEAVMSFYYTDAANQVG